MITKNIFYPLTRISKDTRITHLKDNITYGDYPVRSELAELKWEEFIVEEMPKRYLLPILKDKFMHILDTKVYSIYIV